MARLQLESDFIILLTSDKSDNLQFTDQTADGFDLVDLPVLGTTYQLGQQLLELLAVSEVYVSYDLYVCVGLVSRPTPSFPSLAVHPAFHHLQYT